MQLPIDTPAKIYLMRNDFGLYKIGISINPEDRRAQIENSSGVPVTILDLFDSIDAYQEEQALHSALKDVRRCGEWFALGDDQAARACVTRGLNFIRKAPDDAVPIERTTKYQMGIEDVERALRETSSNLYSTGDKVHLFYQERLLVGTPALKVATAVVHSSLVKAGYYRPDRSVITQYLEALALMRAPAPKKETGLLNHWLAECCHTAQGLTAPNGALFESWRRYAEAAGEDAGSLKRFSQSMRKFGFVPYRTGKERGFHKVALKAGGNELSKAIAELPKPIGREMTVTELLQLIGWPTARDYQVRAGRTLRESGVSHRIVNGRRVYRF
ncbi:GIY-YIG nuclease family protein [Stutzerimonas nitrititolerans]|uniref:GIY-YIG nuclease family protein n=1 Tax=Stutzerimonas nitrititolerans TaxID=2482751 RepID=UPI0028B1E95F|nr:GIY-YIG nuclease family protein [Stutzerimonas nitrititolerans]